MRRRSCASTRNTYRTWNRMVGTVKKSTETRDFTWLSRNVRHVGGRLAAADHILAHAGLADVDVELEQFAVNPRSAPKWVLTTHGANQRAHLFRHGRPPWLIMSDLPSPEQSKAFPLPADDGRRFDDKDAGLPVVPDRAQPSPQESIGRSQFRSFDGALQNAELVAENQDLELQRRTAPEGSENSGPESRQ